MTAEAAHALTLEDRGEGHIHRYDPVCECGWRGPHGRRRTAERYYREHVETNDRISRRQRRGGGPPGPRQPTDDADLPDALRHHPPPSSSSLG